MEHWDRGGVIEFRNATIIIPMVNVKNKPLFILDGVEQKDIQSIESFDPNSLKGISVIKDARNTTQKYGDKAKYGVVEILTWTTIGDVGVEGVGEEGGTAPVEMKIEAPSPADSNKIWKSVEIEASFKGGEAAWTRYLESNLDMRIPKKKGAPPATYTAWLQFIVEKDGRVHDIKVLSAHGFGIEEEALRLMKTTDGGWGTESKWVAAVQNGRAVRSYKMQAVTFVVEE